MDLSSPSPLPPTATVANAFKEGASPGSTGTQHCLKNGTNKIGAVDEDAVAAENNGGDGPCKMIKMATTEEKVFGFVLTRRLKFSNNKNDATTEGYEHLEEGAVL